MNLAKIYNEFKDLNTKDQILLTMVILNHVGTGDMYDTVNKDEWDLGMSIIDDNLRSAYCTEILADDFCKVIDDAEKLKCEKGQTEFGWKDLCKNIDDFVKKSNEKYDQVPGQLSFGFKDLGDDIEFTMYSSDFIKNKKED